MDGGTDSHQNSIIAPQVKCVQMAPKISQRIQEVHSESGELISGKIISKAGKATGKFSNCFNLCNEEDNNVCWLDFEKDFTEWSQVPDEAEMFLLYSSDDVSAAKEREIRNWRKEQRI